jgi:hypothetical protein
MQKLRRICCFPAFWFIILILALVFGLFFVIVGKSKFLAATDVRNTQGNQTATAHHSYSLRKHHSIQP